MRTQARNSRAMSMATVIDRPKRAGSTAHAGVKSRPSSGATRSGLTPRSLIVGLLLTVLVDLWIHWAELVVAGGGRGHSALVNTSIPVGPFSVFFVVTAINLLFRAIMPSTALTKAEMLVIYVMTTTSCVMSSSGQLHFIVPTIAAAWHYATPTNGWASTFHRYVPNWLAQTDPIALNGFYLGNTPVPFRRWLPQMGAWIGFMLALAAASFFIVSILRKQWVEREWLSFPTVALPVSMLDESGGVLRNRLFRLGALGPFLVSAYNAFALNWPIVPPLNLRATYDANRDLGQMFASPPWNAMGHTPVSFYPFVIGIAYLAPVDVTFSSWFFFAVTRIERIAGAAFGINAQTGGQYSVYPYLGYQGAGAFLALTIVSIWTARSYIADVFRTALGRRRRLDDSAEPVSYRTAVIGLAISLLLLVGFCHAAGMSVLAAIAVILLGLMYMIAATRIRAETGNPWLFGPDVDVNTLMTRTFGSHLLGAQDLTILAFLRPAIANFDMRCMTMPHQMDAFKMANEAGASRRSVAAAIAVSTSLGLTASWIIALTIWHRYGAEAGTDQWRTSQGQVPFTDLVSILRNPVGPDTHGIEALVVGFAVMASLMFLRTRLPWWPFHPFGYAIANTSTMESVWLPFFLAWLFKICALRYGGSRFYKSSIPFFLGMIAGDLIGGGLFTAIACFTDLSAYPINW